MKIIEKLHRESPAFSFEFFPPKDEAGVEQLFQTVRDLAPYKPTYVSVTWGAGGSTRRLTIDLVRRIKKESGIEAMAHLTCVGATKEDIAGVLAQLTEAGIENVLALRGDPPRGESKFVKTEGGFGSGAELVRFIRGGYDFCLGGACYPETHPEATDAETDLGYLKEKTQAGTDFLVTQLFFDNRDYFSFVERARKVGITQKIVAGIWPITNLAQIKRITGMCGATIPPDLLAKLENAKEPDAVRAVGVAHAIAQCRELVAHGVPGIHFYTLNRSHATVDILEALRKSGQAA
ncbi:MAG TPA: methylenetetrahydrofolate reductase [NAD(P)H] [Polyangiaceae bacterium]|nr:methylenetetrahydrofolate reductase [NAD(P)H] [Polyangiaceae bacterium]